MAAVSFWIISVMVVTSLAVQVSSKGIGLRHRRQNEEPTTVTGGLEVTSMLPTAQSPGEEISTDEPTTQTRTSAVAVTANEDSARDACETATTPWTPWSAKWENIKDKDCGRRRRTRRIRNETLVEKCQSLGVLLSEFEEFCKSELYTGPQLRIIRKLSWTNHVCLLTSPITPCIVVEAMCFLGMAQAPEGTHGVDYNNLSERVCLWRVNVCRNFPLRALFPYPMTIRLTGDFVNSGPNQTFPKFAILPCATKCHALRARCLDVLGFWVCSSVLAFFVAVAVISQGEEHTFDRDVACLDKIGR